MGKWVEVDCTCLNRTPLPESDYFGRPHRNKRRLTKKKEQDVQEWEQTTEGMYECGHRNGVLVEFNPGDIVNLGDLVSVVFQEMKSTFEIFSRVGDWRCYYDEQLLISPEESQLWLIEIDELRQGFQGIGTIPFQKMEKLLIELHRRELGMRNELERSINEIAEKVPFAPIAGLRRALDLSERPDLEATIEKIDNALKDAGKLCSASIETGNSIRLLW